MRKILAGGFLGVLLVSLAGCKTGTSLHFGPYVTNVSESSDLLKGQLQRLDATVNDVVDRTRLQVIRADELINRTMDRVEDATETVHKTVVSPVRQLSGLLHGVTAALEFLRHGKNGRREGVSVPQDEMFI